MNTIRNRNRLVQPIARFLRQLLSGFAPATAVRKHLPVERPGVAHGSSRAALGLWPTVKHACNPAQPGQLPASRPRRKSAQCPAPPQGAVRRQVSGSPSKERAGEANPLTSANSPRSSPLLAAPHFPESQESRGRKSRRRATTLQITGGFS